MSPRTASPCRPHTAPTASIGGRSMRRSSVLVAALLLGLGAAGCGSGGDAGT
ncbi:hypothetical protein [Patulibacter americanus]|uniref:hypothetical protein n=1 Tax=Patulibacter americanus TaxID=588672 RepID=UPI0003B30829|nr:hypothetical protein [Patulibacter americanus]